jgi:hypothetical protein
VAVAALEPHFAARLCEAAGLGASAAKLMHKKATHETLASFFLTQTRQQLDRLATRQDIPLHSLAR